MACNPRTDSADEANLYVGGKTFTIWEIEFPQFSVNNSDTQ
jgi:hypothetical protein